MALSGQFSLIQSYWLTWNSYRRSNIEPCGRSRASVGSEEPAEGGTDQALCGKVVLGLVDEVVAKHDLPAPGYDRDDVVVEGEMVVRAEREPVPRLVARARGRDWVYVRSLDQTHSESAHRAQAIVGGDHQPGEPGVAHERAARSSGALGSGQQLGVVGGEQTRAVDRGMHGMCGRDGVVAICNEAEREERA